MNPTFARLAALLLLALLLPACAHYHGGHGYGYGHPGGWGRPHGHARPGGYWGYAQPRYGYRPPAYPRYGAYPERPREFHGRAPGFAHWNAAPAPRHDFGYHHERHRPGGWSGHGMDHRANRWQGELGPSQRRLNRQEARRDEGHSRPWH